MVVSSIKKSQQYILKLKDTCQPNEASNGFCVCKPISVFVNPKDIFSTDNQGFVFEKHFDNIKKR